MALTVFLSYKGDVYHSELGSEDSDEPAHYVTGLLIHDYVVKKFPESPLSFAARYYLHYPKIALGVWPPFFHIVEAFWMMVFSARSVFFLPAAITTLTVMMGLFNSREVVRKPPLEVLRNEV